MRLWFVTAATAGLMSAPAMAAPYHASGVSVQNAAAVLNVIAEDRQDVDVTVQPGTRLPAPSVSVVGNRLVIDGGLRDRIEGCGGWFQFNRGPLPVRVRGVGRVEVAALPHIVVRVPRTLDLDASGAVYTNIAPSNGGQVALSGCGDANIAQANGALKLTLNGSGDVHAQAISGPLNAVLNGSGDVSAAGVQGASLRLNGSGDVSLGNVGGPLEALLRGSGDLRTGAVAGPTRLELDGSGDVGIGNVRGPLSVQVSGSGDLVVASVEGPTVQLQLDASGDVGVHGGRTESLAISASGSGDVSFRGAAANADLEVHGSGDVYVGHADHVTQHKSGSGDISIGR